MRPGVLIQGEWQEGLGPELSPVSPIDQSVTWVGRSADDTQVHAAVQAARKAFPTWKQLPFADREFMVQAFAARIQASRSALAEKIVAATGKPKWEALQETDLIPAKVKVSLAAHLERLAEKTIPFEGYQGKVRYKPHGVAVVLGPFNLPAHLPHSHIIPALLAGNTVVFKPSEFTPAVGEHLAECWQDAQLPPGVFNLVQGGRSTGEALARHPELDALYFTGSYGAGLALSRLFAETPGKMLALELGGNNPLVVWEPEDADLAANLIVQSAFLTAGQRCVCARRLILPEGDIGKKVLNRLLAWSQALRFGLPHEMPEPFYGTVIHKKAAQICLGSQDLLLKQGARSLLQMTKSKSSSCLLSPGILDVTHAHSIPDDEIFGPLLQVIRVPDFESAIQAANATSYGLAAGLISSRPELWQTFQNQIRAGVVNWNRQTTGASGQLPFGGIGRSGNHRPSAFTAADYCAYPMASLESATLAAVSLPPGLVQPSEIDA